MLSAKLAENIVKEVRKLIGEDIIVVKTDGTIIASTDKKRVGTFHEGAMLASKQKRKFIITEEDVNYLKGVKAGINLPIFFQRDVIGVIGITGDPEKVTPFGEVIRKMTELLINENYFAEQFEWQSRTMESFIMDWIQAGEWDPSFLSRARVLDVNLSIDRIAAIVELVGKDHVIPRNVWSSIINWFQKNQNDIIIRWGNERIVLLLDGTCKPERPAIEKKLSAFISFLNSHTSLSAYAGVGQLAAPKEIRNSFRQAERALKVARQKERITFDEELTLEMILDDLSFKTKMEFINRTIGRLLDEKELLETIKELFNQNHSLKNTAAALHIHINTLHYRFKKIADLTQLDINNVQDLLNLFLALILLDEHTKNSE